MTSVDEATAAPQDVDYVALSDYVANHQNQIDVYQGDLLILQGYVLLSDLLFSYFMSPFPDLS